jgi:hypothetical protein
VRPLGNRILVIMSIIIIFTPAVNSITFEEASNTGLILKKQNRITEGLSENFKVEELSYKFYFETYQIERMDRVWDNVEFDNCQFDPIPWTPMVPFKNIILETENEIIDVNIKAINQITIQDLVIEPTPEPQWLAEPEDRDRLSQSRSDELELEDEIEKYLAIGQYYPTIDFMLTKLDTKRTGDSETNIYSLQIYPFKYNPDLRLGVGHSDVKVTLFYDNSEGQNHNTVSKPESGNDQTESDEPVGGDELSENNVDYIIITTSKLMDELESLAAWKQRKGISTEIVDVSDIYRNESFNGYDEPEEIRNFIQYAYKNLNTEYVLLAGDWDTIPPRMCYDPDPYPGADDGEIPTDSYYSCISEGTTWDVDEDQIYGELGDLDDIYPDIVVSRISINSEIKMSDWVEEVINYEKYPPSNNWTDKVILLGPNVHNSGDGAKQSEYFYNNYLKFIYNSFDKFYEDTENEEQRLSRSEVIRSINQGASFINYLGHGGPSTWTYNYGYSKLIDKGDVNRFTNKGMKPVVYAMSCLTGWFDDPSGSGYGNFGDCIGETFTEDVVDGGIGYIGSARTSVGSINQKYGPFATGLQEDFIRQLSQLNFGLGDAFTEGKKHYSEVWGNHFTDTNSYGEIQACWLEVNLLGEPELTLWKEKPQSFVISNKSGDDNLIITVRNETGGLVKGAKVCLQLTAKTGEVQYSDIKTTTSNGEAIFYIIGLPPKLNLTITKTNFIPYLERITIKDMIPPVTSYQITPEMPDGDNDWYVSQPEINLTVNEESMTYYYWDDEPESTYSQPITVPEGNHTLTFYSVDIAKNNESINQVHLKVDLTPPKTEIQFNPEKPNGKDGWFTVQPAINLTTEPDASSYYSLDNGLNISFIRPIIAPVGIHEMRYYSKDTAGNIGEIELVTVKVDITPPETNLKIDPELPTGFNGWYRESPKIHLESEAGSETYYYWSELGVVEDKIGDQSIKNSKENLYITPMDCPEGKNLLNYYSIDSSGCVEDIKTYTVKLDTIKPSMECSLFPLDPDGENDFYVSDVEITLNSSEMGQIFYFWNDDYPIPYSNPFKALEGVNTLTYYSMDDAGNVGDESQLEIKMDTTPPVTKLVLDPLEATGENDWYNILPELEFDTEPGATVYYSYEWFDESIAPARMEVPEGENKITFYAVDLAGNVGEKTSETIKVDITPPKAKLDAIESSNYVGQVVTFMADESKDNNEIKEYFIDFGDGETSGWTNSPYIKHAYSKPGEYDAKLIVVDSSGQENIKEEIYPVFIIKESEETDLFSMENIALIITIIASVFIILSGLFVYTYRRYSDTNSAKALRKPGAIGFKDNSYHGQEDQDYDYESGPDYSHELEEAIIIDKPIVFKMKQIRCPGCKTVFVGEEGSSSLKCPGCGLTGGLPRTTSSSRLDLGKTPSSRIELKQEQEGSSFFKYKCPACNKMFKTSATNKIVKCPNCGIEGRI